jgi:hypothetical protein
MVNDSFLKSVFFGGCFFPLNFLMVFEIANAIAAPIIKNVIIS